MLHMVDEPGLFEFKQRDDKSLEEFDDFDATPCPQDWERYMRQSSLPTYDKNSG